MLHLGNISFAQSESDEAELEGGLSQESLLHVSELLQVRDSMTCASKNEMSSSLKSQECLPLALLQMLQSLRCFESA